MTAATKKEQSEGRWGGQWEAVARYRGARGVCEWFRWCVVLFLGFFRPFWWSWVGFVRSPYGDDK